MLPPGFSVRTIFSPQASSRIWTAVQLSPLRKNAQVLVLSSQGDAGRRYDESTRTAQSSVRASHQRPMRTGPSRWTSLGSGSALPSSTLADVRALKLRHKPGETGEEGEAGLTDLASTASRMRHALGAR